MSLISTIKKSFFVVTTGTKVLLNFGPKVFFIKFKRYFFRRIYGNTTKNINEEYPKWISKNTLTQKQISLLRKEIKKFSYHPKISIIMPVFNVGEEFLRTAIDSVFNQIYTNWELCICDDASTLQHVRPTLDEYALKDDRVILEYSRLNYHISINTNKCINLANGEFILLFDNDDELSIDYLYEVVKALNENKNLDFIYPDEDQLMLNQETNSWVRANPTFKPDWSPETTLSYMYTTHAVFRKKLVNEIGGFRKGFEGSQDYDFVLRFTEKIKNENIHHISKILYHWRRIPESTADNYLAKPYSRETSVKALEETIIRRNIKATLETGLTQASFRIKREILNNPKVSIIIPTHNKCDILKVLIDSIEDNTTYKNFEIIIIDHNSNEEFSINYLDSIKNKYKVIKYTEKFNYSAINNFAVKKASGEHLLFLNNDMKVISEDWIESLLEFSQQEEIGAVGAKLIFPNNTIQHAGVVLSPELISHHLHMEYPKDDYGYMDRIAISQNISAVTGACLMIKKVLFEKVEGFDEELPVAFNDTDLCLKLLDKGYRNIYTPFAQLYHYESLTRGKYDSSKKILEFAKETEYFKKKWIKYIEHDPYFNENLTIRGQKVSLKI